MKIESETEYDAAIERVSEFMSKTNALTEVEGIEFNKLCDSISEYENMILGSDFLDT